MARRNAPAGSASTEKPLIGELERLGPGGREALVIGVGAPGFEALSLQEKTFAYLMYRAAIPGNAIAYHQAHRDAYAIVRLLETAFAHSAGLEKPVRDGLHDYLKMVWLHHGQYNHHTHHKFVPATLTPHMLSDAVRHAEHQGARFDKPTDVLSFPSGDSGSELGDIAVSIETAKIQARQNGLSLDREIAQLILHGLLHLCGYDHETDNGEMNRLELKLRRRLKI